MKQIKIDTYVCSGSSLHKKQYLSVPSGTDLAAIGLPEAYKKTKLTRFKMGHVMDVDKPYIAVDAKDLQGQIEKKGYAEHGSQIRFDEKE